MSGTRMVCTTQACSMPIFTKLNGNSVHFVAEESSLDSHIILEHKFLLSAFARL